MPDVLIAGGPAPMTAAILPLNVMSWLPSLSPRSSSTPISSVGTGTPGVSARNIAG
jgi:hypothetical protein